MCSICVCFVMPCIIVWTCIMFVCASCHAYVVVLFMCWLLSSDCFFSIEFQKRSECEDSFDYVGSSFSWTRSSSKRDLRQDDHFPGYHYYHCHASCLVSIAMSRYLPLVYQALPKCHDKPLTLHIPANHCLAMLPLAQPSYSCRLLPCDNMDIFVISQYYCYLI